MDFRPSQSQHLLVSTAREFLRKHCPIEVAQRLATDTRGFDLAVWRQMAELGWTGLLVPSELGGSDGSILDVVLLVEAMGYAALPAPFVASAVVATSLVLHAGTDALGKRLLPAMAAGDRIATLALVEESASFDPREIALTCAVPGRLTGRKLFVAHAEAADSLIVAVRSRNESRAAVGPAANSMGVTLLVIPGDRPGVARRPLDVLGGDRVFEVEFDGVEVGTGDGLGAPGRGGEALAHALRAGALARTAEMIGGAQRVLDVVLEHARTRVQGGRPIGGYQAIQHACADAVRDVDAARGLLYAASWKTAGGLPADADVAMAKAYADEACLAVARRGHQILGAISYCDEHPMHLLHKRILAASRDFGDTPLHLETVAQAIGLA